MEAISPNQSWQDGLEQFAVCVEHESWTRQQLKEYQVQALRACRDYAYAHSPFYQRFHRGLYDRPLEELPVLSKALMMEHFDELVTDRAIRLHEVRQYLTQSGKTGLYLDRYQVSMTSGSTGEPGIYLYNQSEGVINGNGYLRSLRWGGATPTDKAAVLASTALSQGSSRLPVAAKGQALPRLNLSASAPLETLVSSLNEYQPDALLGYASITTVLAEEQRAGRLQIAPRVIFCVADTLTEAMRQRIQAVWPVPLYNAYGTSEGGVLAAECSAHQGLHLFEDFSLLEVVDEQNRPVPAGQQGAKALLTVFFRRTQPLIRYELSDLVRPSALAACSCGRPFALLENIEGRTVEMLSMPSVSGEEKRVSPYLLHALFHPLPITGWQVMQEADGLHVFLTGAAPELTDEQVREAFRQTLQERGVRVPPIEIHRVAALRRNVSGKTPLVIPYLSPRTPGKSVQ